MTLLCFSSSYISSPPSIFTFTRTATTISGQIIRLGHRDRVEVSPKRWMYIAAFATIPLILDFIARKETEAIKDGGGWIGDGMGKFTFIVPCTRCPSGALSTHFLSGVISFLFNLFQFCVRYFSFLIFSNRLEHPSCFVPFCVRLKAFRAPDQSIRGD